jgi:large subunit ribosomal protein L15
MKNLSNLSPAHGSTHSKKRVGRGIGSGLGKTAGKGHKGQKARSGGKCYPGFEGGQMPMYRRLPKRGFTNHFRVEYNEVNLAALNGFNAGETVTPEMMLRAGLLRNASWGVKLLGKGKLEKKLTVKVHKVSQAAKAAVEKAGGAVEEIKEIKA